MTPMVDLGFLLLTFFILTTTFNKPQAMQLTMPKKDENIPLEDQSKVPADHTMNVLLTKDNTVYWYFGMADPTKGALPALNKATYGPNGLRKVLIAENNKRHGAYDAIEKLKNEVATGKMPKDSLGKKKGDFFSDKTRKTSILVVLLKPDKDAKYKNIVDALDEMAICNIGTYALLESNEVENQMIANAQTYK
jgi:biopolymer transport protein ExbD